MLNRAALGAIALVSCLAGCAGSSTPELGPTESVSPPSLPPESTVDQAVVLPAPATFASAGLAFSDCGFRSSVMTHRHEWAEDLVPAEYRQLNTLGVGNTGQSNLNVLACSGAAVGNESFFSGIHFAYYGVLVEAPASRSGTGGNFFLLDLLTDRAELAAQFGSVGLPVSIASFDLSDQAVAVASPQFAATVDEPGGYDFEDESLFHSRLHWVVAGQACWMDFAETAHTTKETVADFHGEAGNASALSGPLHEAPGLASQGTEDSLLGAPSCEARSA